MGENYKRLNHRTNINSGIHLDLCVAFEDLKNHLTLINVNRIMGVFLDKSLSKSEQTEIHQLFNSLNITDKKIFDLSQISDIKSFDQNELDEKIENWLQSVKVNGVNHFPIEPENKNLSQLLNASKVAAVIIEYAEDHVWLSEKSLAFFNLPSDVKFIHIQTLFNFFLPEDREILERWVVNLKEKICEQVTLQINDLRKNVIVEGMNYESDTIKKKAVEKVLIFHTESKSPATVHDYAHFDALTGLPNRYLFYDRLKIAIANSKRRNNITAVLMLDLDHFKRVNDVLGYEYGDLLLKEVSKLLKYTIRETDTIARVGGNEFMFVLTDLIRSQNAVYIANKILGYFSKPFKLAERDVFISASIGMAFYPDDAEDLESLIKSADMAMNRAKHQGRNNYQLYSPEMNSRAFEQLSLESSLRKAIQNEEFVLYYQPQINVVTRQIVGAEALIRWKHPDLGVIGPDVFIPLAEETGLIIPLGEWILKKAVFVNQHWKKMGFPHFRIAVNISPRQFQDFGFTNLVQRVLAEIELDPSCLELEITETLAMSNLDQTFSILSSLSKMGIHISIDDFGTGYSSLQYLKKFPINTIKIDQSFVRDLVTDNDDAMIVKAICAMGHGLNLQLVAEGVESFEQVEFLKSLNVTKMQGYYFSTPLALSDFNTLLQNSNKQGFFPVRS